MSLTEKLQEWQKWDKNEKTLKEINHLFEKNDYTTLEKLLLTRMEFGTAGLRARMGPGNSQMNDLTIIQTTQGFVKYCESQLPTLSQDGIAVGFDGRYNSKKWATFIANIFSSRGHKVYWMSSVCPTPFIPFTIRHFHAACGVMVTASHNPKEDNGYKVYWNNGSQIISPHDAGIAKSILENLQPWENSWQVEITSPLVEDVLNKVLEIYMEKQFALCFNKELNVASDVAFTYTAMHGVGWPFAQRMFQLMGFQHVIPVIQQRDPDPEFPTVRFPNPEEGKSALNLSIETAEANNSKVILANDPDADRLAAAEKQSDGKWKIFTGNELGALIGWWLFKNFHGDLSTAYMLASTVSSKLIAKIAQKEGFHFEETLTGFKWMGNLSDSLIKQGKTVLFAFEEAIGYMCGSQVLDKDGVSALGVLAQLVAFAYNNGINLNQQLEKIYEQYGQCVTNNSYYLCYEQTVIRRMFHRISHWNGEEKEEEVNYPKSCGPYEILHVRDLNVGYDSHYDDKKPRLPVSRSSQMITFDFANGAVVTIRTSGTEPKIKYYSELCGKPEEGKSREELQKELDDLIGHVVEQFYQPDKNGLTARSD